MPTLYDIKDVINNVKMIQFCVKIYFPMSINFECNPDIS